MLKADLLIENNKTQKKVRFVTLFLYYFGILISLLTFFTPFLFKNFIMISAAYPFICLFFIKIYPDIIYVVESLKKPCVLSGLFFVGYSHAMLAISSHSIGSGNLEIYSVIMTVIYMIIFVINNHALFKIENWLYIFCYSIAIWASFECSLINLNRFLDDSEAEIFVSSITDKSISTLGFKSNYYLELSPWGPKEKNSRIKVEKYIYEKFQIKEFINVYFHKGAFGMPWYTTGKYDYNVYERVLS